MTLQRLPANEVLFTCLLAMSASAQAQNWPDPYKTPNTVGQFLEEQFSGIMMECGMPQLREETGVFHKTTVKTSVPTVVRQRVPMNKPVVVRERESAARVFGYIQSDNNVSTVTRDPGRYLLEDMEADPVPMLATGMSSVAHTHTCSSVVTAGAQANLNIPLVDLKTALSADFSNKKQTVLALVEGTFFSPISSMLNLGNQVDQTFARLLFWEWYSRNPPVGSPVYIKQFDGFTLYEFAKERRDLNGQVSFSAALGAPGIASIKTQVQAGVLVSDGTDIKAFATGFYVDPVSKNAYVQTEPVPSPAALSTELSKVRAIATVEDPLVLENRTSLHTVEIQGMPAALCSVSAWLIDPQPTSGTLALRTANELDNNKSCRFTTTFSARPEVFTAANSNVSLQYAVTSASSVSGQQVRFSVSQINLTTSRSPMVAVAQVNPSFSPRRTTQGAATKTELTWQVPIVIDDRQNPLRPGGLITVRQGSLSCEQGEVAITTDQQITVSPEHQAVISVTHSVFAGEDFDENASPARDCRFTATVDLPLQDGGSATRTLATTHLLYPAKKQVSAAVAPNTPAATPVSRPPQL
jgi:hypothetical protein